jgi:hypothetical protein
MLPGPVVLKHKKSFSVTGSEKRCVLKIFAKVSIEYHHIAVAEVVG